jgi:hypothetical protein
MEGSKRRSGWIPKVERGFEWSRLEDELLAAAYEHALPMLQCGAVDERLANRSDDGSQVMEVAADQAAGA